MPEMRASRSKTRSFARRLPVIFSTSQVVQIRKQGPTAAADAVGAAERALVEEREEGAHAGQHVDQFVQLELENQKSGNLAQLAVLEHDGQVLDEQHGEVATDAERDLGEHGVHVG